MTRTRTRLLFVLCALLAQALVGAALAEPPKGRGRATVAAPKKHRAKPKKGPKRGASSHEQRGVAAHKEESPKVGDDKSETKGDKALTDAQKLARDAAQGANAQIVKEGDTSVKVMQFSGLDIEGRLKSPQLLYFVSRVHAEFDRPKLPHRSFMPELERSTAEEPVR
jgi:hypothetical protein